MLDGDRRLRFLRNHKITSLVTEDHAPDYARPVAYRLDTARVSRTAKWWYHPHATAPTAFLGRTTTELFGSDVNRGFLFGLVILIVYFLPAISAKAKDARNAAAIFVLNLLVGWTFIGWVVALVWACSANDPERNGGARRP